MKVTNLAIALGLAFSATAANAVPYFDRDGAGPSARFDLSLINFGASTFVARGGNQAVAAFGADLVSGQVTPGSADYQFDVYYQTTIANFVNANGQSRSVNDGEEYTIIVGFREEVTGLTTATTPNDFTATFTTVSGPTWFQMFYDTNANSNALTGSGFQDGRLIMSGDGVRLGDSGLFSTDQDVQNPLDGFGDNNYPGQDTRNGTGNQTSLVFSNFTTDTSFIGGVTELALQFQNLSIGIPFLSVNPMHCFAQAQNATAVGATSSAEVCDTVIVAGPFSAQGDGGLGGYVPVIGTINGSVFSDGLNPDFIAATQGFASVTGKVPEPSVLALMGIAFAGLGFARRQKR
jgi:hypothetical protein